VKDQSRRSARAPLLVPADISRKSELEAYIVLAGKKKASGHLAVS
jgi:hypothetical protein